MVRMVRFADRARTLVIADTVLERLGGSAFGLVRCAAALISTPGAATESFPESSFGISPAVV